MKQKIDSKKPGQQLWEDVKPVLMAAIGGGIVSVAAGRSGLARAPRGQTTEVVAFGVLRLRGFPTRRRARSITAATRTPSRR